jgi:ATP-dependent exoDNAse (exonuclease V) alpha subunit
MSNFMDHKYEYIFIDEISMVQEIFYKFFIYLQRAVPNLKFIIAGDFNQLLPVKDRIHNCNYKNILALHELCNGNKLILTKCRRSDDTLFNMLLPENINKITKSTFGNIFTDRHISFTNAKRIEVNNIMMDKVIKAKKKKPLRLSKLTYDKT